MIPHRFDLGQTVYIMVDGRVQSVTVTSVEIGSDGKIAYVLREPRGTDRFAFESQIADCQEEAEKRYYTKHKTELEDKIRQLTEELKEIDTKLKG